MSTLKCAMTDRCQELVTYIDAKGFVYCTAHGLDRQQSQRCRKLRDFEVRRLERGESLRRY